MGAGPLRGRARHPSSPKVRRRPALGRGFPRPVAGGCGVGLGGSMLIDLGLGNHQDVGWRGAEFGNGLARPCAQEDVLGTGGEAR